MTTVLKAPPKPAKKWRSLTTGENSKIRRERVLWFRKHERRKFKELARWVKRLRRRTKLTQAQFAEAVGASTISIRRWELALGHTPLPKHLERLKELEVKSNRR